MLFFHPATSYSSLEFPSCETGTNWIKKQNDIQIELINKISIKQKCVSSLNNKDFSAYFKTSESHKLIRINNVGLPNVQKKKK